MKISKDSCKTALLTGLLAIATGCNPTLIEGKIIKKEVEPGRMWIEERVTAPIRVPPKTNYFLLTDDEDFIIEVQSFNGRIDRAYVAKELFENYQVGETIQYNPYSLRTLDCPDREQEINKGLINELKKQGISNLH